MLNYRLGTVNEKHWCLNQFSAAANLTLSQHFLEKKKKKSPFTLFNKATKECTQFKHDPCFVLSITNHNMKNANSLVHNNHDI